MYKFSKITSSLVSSEDVASLPKFKKKKGELVWVDALAHTYSDISELESSFGIHKLVLEDAMGSNQRPKVEVHPEYTVIIIKHIEGASPLKITQVTAIVGEGFIVTIHQVKLDEITSILDSLIPKDCEGARLAYKILDKVVDGYFPILDSIEDEIELVEKIITATPTAKGIPSEILDIKRDLLLVRKAVWPSRDSFALLAKGGMPGISDEYSIYFRDIYDHIVHVIDLVETYRDLMGGIMETYLSAISNSTNEVMKVLTVIATIFIPLTFITGLYGMNFKIMPEITWEYGYIFALLLMCVTAIGLILFFKKKKWL